MQSSLIEKQCSSWQEELQVVLFVYTDLTILISRNEKEMESVYTIYHLKVSKLEIKLHNFNRMWI